MDSKGHSSVLTQALTMRASYVRQTFASLCVLLVVIPLLSVVSANGSGLLLDSTTLVIVGDLEEGVGDVNISINVRSHDVASVGALNMTLVEGESTIIASENVSLNLTSDEITTIQFNISQLAIGQYTMNLQLYGEVGTPFANHTGLISQFVKRLAPANAQVSETSQWQIIPVNSISGEASGNASFRDGDTGWAEVPVSNSGEVDFNGSIGFAIDNGPYLFQNLTIPPQSSTPVNFTIPQLFESNLTTLKVNLSGQVTTHEMSVGPPPLARLDIIANADNSTPQLGQQVIWTVNLSNSGELAWVGELQCTFSNSVVFSESFYVNQGEGQSRQFSLSVRPGALACSVPTTVRLHDDSVTSFSHSYDMDAAHFSAAGSAGLAIVGTNFHVGDDLQATLIAHNGGDYQGNARLSISDSGGSSDGLSRQFSVGNSLQLDVSHTLQGGAGSRILSWAVVSEDGLVDVNLSGQVEVQVSPSQQLGGEITSVDWTTSDGLVADIDLQLSEGRSRIVRVQVGHSNGDGFVTVIDTDIELAPGQRSLSFDLGEPQVAEEVWLSLTVTDWAPASLSQMNSTRSASEPDVQPSAILGVSNPAVPVNGESVTIAYTLSNDGSDNIAGGVLVLKVSSTNEILWQESAPLVEAGDSQSGEISVNNWPSGVSVGLHLEWRSGGSQTMTTKSYPSKAPTISDSFEIPWAAIIYGAIAGIVVSAVARFVFVWQGEDPGDKKQQRTQRREARATAKEDAKKVRQERLNPTGKQEVGCPSCGMTLRVPNDYDGQARCPACTHVFPVTPVEISEPEPQKVVKDDEDIEQVAASETTQTASRELKKKVAAVSSQESAKHQQVEKKKAKPQSTVKTTLSSISVGDEIRCPSCGQRLKVPYDRRPIMAKCPRCETKFMAEKQ